MPGENSIMQPLLSGGGLPERALGTMSPFLFTSVRPLIITGPTPPTAHKPKKGPPPFRAGAPPVNSSESRLLRNVARSIACTVEGPHRHQVWARRWGNFALGAREQRSPVFGLSWIGGPVRDGKGARVRFYGRARPGAGGASSAPPQSGEPLPGDLAVTKLALRGKRASLANFARQGAGSNQFRGPARFGS